MMGQIIKKLRDKAPTLKQAIEVVAEEGLRLQVVAFSRGPHTLSPRLVQEDYFVACEKGRDGDTYLLPLQNPQGLLRITSEQ